MCSPTSCPNALDGSSNGVLLSWDPTDLYHCTWSHGHAYGEPLLTHTCARTHTCSSRYTHTAISPPACRHHARAPHCQINCSAALCTRISSSMHPVLPPPPHTGCSSPTDVRRCASGRAKPYTLSLHPQALLMLPTKTTWWEAPSPQTRSQGGPKGDDGTLKKPRSPSSTPTLQRGSPSPPTPRTHLRLSSSPAATRRQVRPVEMLLPPRQSMASFVPAPPPQVDGADTRHSAP